MCQNRGIYNTENTENSENSFDLEKNQRKILLIILENNFFVFKLHLFLTDYWLYTF